VVPGKLPGPINVLLGLTDGHDHTVEIYNFYKKLGYQIIAISDYQYILKKLKQDNPFVAIAHPRLMNAYKGRDMQNLTDYDAIEVLNHFRNSVHLWDAALSVGRAVWIVGNDDSHNIHNPQETGVCWTMINANSTHYEDVLEALKKRSDVRCRRGKWIQ